MKILIIRQDKLGDVMLTTALPASIKRAIPEAEVHVMVQPAWLSVFERNPHVDRVLSTEYKPNLIQYPALISTLKEQRYDAVILGKQSSRAHTNCATWAGIPIRAGFSCKNYAHKLTHNLMSIYTDDRHEVDWMRMLGEAALERPLNNSPLVFPTTAAEQEKADSLLAGLEGFFIVGPTTGGTSRSWGAQNFLEVARIVAERTSLPIVVTGAPGEQEAMEVAQGLPSALNLVGKLTLGELAALQKRAKFLISGSTGSMHLAASQGCPIMLIETRIDADMASQRWAPWMTEHEIALPEVLSEDKSRDPNVAEVLVHCEKLFEKIHLESAGKTPSCLS